MEYWRFSPVLLVGLVIALSLSAPERVKAQLTMTNVGPGGFGVTASAGVGWGDTGTHVTLTTTAVTNDTYTNNDGTWSAARSLHSHSSGKVCAELDFTAGSTSNLTVGWLDGAAAAGSAMDGFIGQFANAAGNLESGGQGFQAGSGFATVTLSGAGFGPLVTSDVLTLCADLTGGKGYLAKNGTWLNGADPVAGTNNPVTFSGSPTVFVGLSLQISTDGSMQIKTGSVATLPSGYSVWN